MSDGVRPELVVKHDTTVRCSGCGREERVEYARCMAAGWPRCHGTGMSLAQAPENVREIWRDPPLRPRTVETIHRIGPTVTVYRRVLGNGQLAFRATSSDRRLLATYDTANAQGAGGAYGQIRDRVGDWPTVGEWLDALTEATGEALLTESEAACREAA